MKSPSRGKSAFTLIELIIVIAIVAFVTVIGLHSYGNLKEVEARKMNMANIKRVYHALSTYEALQKEQANTGFFNGFDSLIDVSASGGWTGAAGSFDWGVDDSGAFNDRDARTVHSGIGIYDGSWKVLGALYNAAGQGSGATDTIASAQEKNKGTRETGLYKQLGIYYLTDSDVTLLKNAGISSYVMHNPSSQQASGSARNGFCTAVTTENGINYSSAKDGHLKLVAGGGPGFRPDMSGFYPVALTNGSPVAVIQPGSTIYDDFGFALGYTNSTFTATQASAALSSVKLLAFGIGLNAECVRNQYGLGEAPVNPYFDKRNYRYYIAVFAIKAGGQGVAATCRLAGVIDCAGNTYRAAEYGVNWTTQL